MGEGNEEKGYGREKRLGYTCRDNVGSLTSHNPIDLHGLLQG
jgi:hypothetical protein